MQLVGNQYKIRLTSKFGEISEIRNGRPHTGIDLALNEGTNLHSIVSGKIERVVSEGNLGNGVIIRGDDGRAYIYGHLKEIDVTEGEYINAGDFLGTSGSSGNSTGPHLHFGVQEPNGEFIDPEPLADTLADMTGSGGGFLDGVKKFFENGQVDQYDKGDNVVLEYLGAKLGDLLTAIWDWVVMALPDIMGYSTIIAGIIIILTAFFSKGGAIKSLLGYGAFLILAVCILAYQ